MHKVCVHVRAMWELPARVMRVDFGLLPLYFNNIERRFIWL